MLPRVHGEDGELGGSGCPLSPQSGQPAVCPGQAHVCRAPADPPQERSLVAERESVPEGKDGEHGVRRIPVVLLQKNLLVRENPQKTGCFRPLATLLFILLNKYAIFRPVPIGYALLFQRKKAVQDLESIGELRTGSSPVQDTTIETRLRFLERVSEFFSLSPIW